MAYLLSGNDTLAIDGLFVISIYGTGDVLTAVGITVEVSPYIPGKRNQLWRCKENNQQLGLMNLATEVFMGRDGNSRLQVDASHLKRREYVIMRPHPEGGFILLFHKDTDNWDVLCKARLASTTERKYIQLGCTESTLIGVTRMDQEVMLPRFRWVFPGKLARSQAPHYNAMLGDASQSIDDAVVRALVTHGITRIISLNFFHPLEEERRALKRMGIAMYHIPIPEFGVPTMDQLDAANTVYSETPGQTLVYCGYGHGRTGTVISALQMFSGLQLSTLQFYENGVDNDGQLKVLDALRSRLFPCLDIVDYGGTPTERCSSGGP